MMWIAVAFIVGVVLGWWARGREVEELAKMSHAVNETARRSTPF